MRNIILITQILSLITFSSVQSAERKLAVIVGVGSYRSSSGLGPLGKAPVNDAHQLSEVLRKQGYTVFEMTHDVARQEGQHLMAPNTAYIRDAIDGMLNFPNLGREDAVIVSFHGHGVQFDEVDITGQKTPRFYFCPADATIKNVQTANQLTERNHLLPLDELYESLNKCTAATKLLVVDACRNDPTRPMLNRSGLASSTLPKLPPPPGGIAAFFSCKPNEVAFQNTEKGYGYFTRYLVDGLQGKADLPLANRPADGVVTFAELSVYVANNTYAEVYALHKAKQSPELRGKLDLNLPLARVTSVKIQAFTNSIGMQLVPIPAGSFMMGSKDHGYTAKPPHRVEISKAFYMQSTEVTQSQWKSVMGTEPWKGKENTKEGTSYPATFINWYDAVEFCRKLSLREGKTYRLPTEAEWEYACRGGTTTNYSFGNDQSQLGDYAWWGGFGPGNANSEKYPHMVGTKKPNPFGLYDMHGNVVEWCSDWFESDYYASSSASDPQGPRPVLGSDSEPSRVLRGGSWLNYANNAYSHARYADIDISRNIINGFRVVVE